MNLQVSIFGLIYGKLRPFTFGNVAIKFSCVFAKHTSPFWIQCECNEPIYVIWVIITKPKWYHFWRKNAKNTNPNKICLVFIRIVRLSNLALFFALFVSDYWFLSQTLGIFCLNLAIFVLIQKSHCLSVLW